MQTATLTIRNKVGLHARPAAVFVQTCQRFGSRITIANSTRGSVPVNGKSILGILTLGAAKGDAVTLSVDGPDEDEAVAILTHAIENRLGESE